MTKPDTTAAVNDWEKSLNLDVRFEWATPEQRKYILTEIKFQRLNVRKQLLASLLAEVVDELEPIDPRIETHANAYAREARNAAKAEFRALIKSKMGERC
jgi:hypothetical protein